MQLTALPLVALAGLASAQTVHVVNVGKNGASGALAYSPDTVTAKVGDMVQFQFVGGSHSVTQSTFDGPCVPVENNNASIAGFYSGTMEANASSTDMATYSIMVNSTAPMWVYCAVATHCQNGMSMVINENTAANSSRSLANYRTASKNTKTVVPSTESGGTDGTSSSNSTASSSGSSSSSGAGSSGSGSGSSGSSGSSNSSSSSGSSGSSGSKTTSTGGSAATGGAIAAVAVPSTFGLLAALGAVFML